MPKLSRDNLINMRGWSTQAAAKSLGLVDLVCFVDLVNSVDLVRRDLDNNLMSDVISRLYFTTQERDWL